MCRVPLKTNSILSQVVQFVFLKTSLSTERSVLKISALGHFDQSVRPLRFRTDSTINEIVISTVHKPSKHGSKSFHPLKLELVTRVVNCVKYVPGPVIKLDDPPPTEAELN